MPSSPSTASFGRCGRICRRSRHTGRIRNGVSSSSARAQRSKAMTLGWTSVAASLVTTTLPDQIVTVTIGRANQRNGVFDADMTRP